MSAAAGLRALADAATPGPWVVHRDGIRQEENLYLIAIPHNIPEKTHEPNARLIALAPELARWAADTAEYMEGLPERGKPPLLRNALLARLASLVSPSHSEAGEQT